MAHGIRIWRFCAANQEWLYRSRTGAETTLARSAVASPTPVLENDDWLFERKNGAGSAVPAALPAADILSVVPDSWVPANGTVWCWVDGGFKRVYHRSTAAANVNEAPPHIVATADDCEEGDIVLDRGEGNDPVKIRRSEREQIEVEKIEGSIDLSGPTVGIGREDFLKALVDFQHRNGAMIEREVKRAAKALEQNEKSAFVAAADALLETFTGAAPAPTQGTNVLHQLNTAIDDTTKVFRAIEDESKATSDASGAMGGFAAGGASVDQTWQAAASVLSVGIDIFKIRKLIAERESAPGVATQQRNADLDKLILGQAATLASNVTKSYSTITGSVNAISTLSSGASILSTGVAVSVPGVGAVTGLATMVRSSWQAEKSRKRKKRLKSILAKCEDQTVDPETGALLEFALDKAVRKHRYKAGEATVAAGSFSASTALAIGAAAAGANAWNPVGWGIGAAVVLGGAGLLGYKIYRRRKSKKRAAKRGFKTSEFPSRLVVSYMQWWRKAADALDAEILAGILESYGVEPAYLRMNHAPQLLNATGKVQAAIARIERHLK